MSKSMEAKLADERAERERLEDKLRKAQSELAYLAHSAAYPEDACALCKGRDWCMSDCGEGLPGWVWHGSENPD